MFFIFYKPLYYFFISFNKFILLNFRLSKTFLYCNLIKDTIIAAKKDVSPIETKKNTEGKNDNKKKDKTIQEIDREKLEKKFNNEKKKLN